MIDAIVQDISYAPGSLPRPNSPFIQLATDLDMTRTQGEENEEEEEEEIEEIPNPKNMKTRGETSEGRKEEIARDKEEKDKTTIIFNNDSNLLYYFLPVMPWMKALTTSDLSYISWTSSKFPNVKVLSQNFPRVVRFARRTIAYNDEGISIPLGIYNKVVCQFKFGVYGWHKIRQGKRK